MLSSFFKDTSDLFHIINAHVYSMIWDEDSQSK